MKTDILIIGAGIAGITLARRMAEEKKFESPACRAKKTYRRLLL